MIFCQLFLTHGNARSPHRTDELAANFMATAPDHPVCRLLNDNAVAGKDQHKLSGNVKIDIESHATIRNVDNKAVALSSVGSDLDFRHTVDDAAEENAFFPRLHQREHNATPIDSPHNSMTNCYCEWAKATAPVFLEFV